MLRSLLVGDEGGRPHAEIRREKNAKHEVSMFCATRPGGENRTFRSTFYSTPCPSSRTNDPRKDKAAFFVEHFDETKPSMIFYLLQQRESNP